MPRGPRWRALTVVRMGEPGEKGGLCQPLFGGIAEERFDLRAGVHRSTPIALGVEQGDERKRLEKGFSLPLALVEMLPRTEPLGNVGDDHGYRSDRIAGVADGHCRDAHGNFAAVLAPVHKLVVSG